MTLVVGELKESAEMRIPGAKKNPKRVFAVKDRVLYLAGDNIDTADVQKPVSHSDVAFVYVIKVKKTAAIMEKASLDDFFKLM